MSVKGGGLEMRTNRNAVVLPRAKVNLRLFFYTISNELESYRPTTPIGAPSSTHPKSILNRASGDMDDTLSMSDPAERLSQAMG